MIIGRLIALLAASASVAVAVELEEYEYVIVGSGAGGGPLAARLALAGHKTLLIEAGDDHGTKLNYSIPAYNAKVSEDEELAWNFFVRHYADDARQARDFKTSYDTPNGGVYTGLSPPAGSHIKGTLYPRTGSLGGCTAHNALIAVYPHQSDFDNIAALTGDASWSADNMRQHFVNMEKNRYLPAVVAGHGYNGWLATEQAPLSIVVGDQALLSMLSGAAVALGNLTGAVINLETLIAGDANAAAISRDRDPGYFQIPLSMNNGTRNGAREFVLAVRDAVNTDGTKKYPLDVRLNCHATKITFDKSVSPPRAAGVEFLDGKYLYRASPLSKSASAGVPGSVNASREVIISGGVYNSPQLLKLSGVGPADELTKFNIPVVADLPGVGTNLQDHYEISVQAKIPFNWTALQGCTWEFESGPDSCLQRWQNPVAGDHGVYSSAGLAAAMLYKSTTAPTADWDTFIFGGPVNFRGYFPGYSYNATSEHDWFTWAILKSHPRNNAGAVTLRSADPLDVPDILFNYFDTGVGDANADVQAMVDAVSLARRSIASQVVPTTEILPGASIATQEEIASYVKDTAWGHHASCTCPIGVDGDPMAVLDSKFRVRGVTGLRVVDASVYPRIPGTFTAVSTYMVGEKAAVDILSGLS